MNENRFNPLDSGANGKRSAPQVVDGVKSKTEFPLTPFAEGAKREENLDFVISIAIDDLLK